MGSAALPGARARGVSHGRNQALGPASPLGGSRPKPGPFGGTLGQLPETQFTRRCTPGTRRDMLHIFAFAMKLEVNCPFSELKACRYIRYALAQPSGTIDPFGQPRRGDGIAETPATALTWTPWPPFHSREMAEWKAFGGQRRLKPVTNCLGTVHNVTYPGNQLELLCNLSLWRAHSAARLIMHSLRSKLAAQPSIPTPHALCTPPSKKCLFQATTRTVSSSVTQLLRGGCGLDGLDKCGLDFTHVLVLI